MPRNRSEKQPTPTLEGVSHKVMEPIRLDAQAGHPLDDFGSAGHPAYTCLDPRDRRDYDDLNEKSKQQCYDAWVSYYADHRNIGHALPTP